MVDNMGDRQFRLEQLVAAVEEEVTDEDPLARLTEAVIVAARLEELSDALVDHFVTEARSKGASWNDIGVAMGVTRQAAQKRFVRRPRSRGHGRSLFTRFGERPRQVVRRAVAIAHQTGADHVGTEHLVLALIENDEDMVPQAIRDLGGDLKAVRMLAASGDPSGPPTKHHIPFGRDGKKTLELALREVIRAGTKPSIEEEHIVLALLRNEGTPGETALRAGGLTHAGFADWLSQGD
jgi:hypothetical protein